MGLQQLWKYLLGQCLYDFFEKAPDFIIEIVSPSSRKMDYIIKLYKYQQAGVREYWIVDPRDKSILVYFFEEETLAKYTFKSQVKVNIYEELEIDFSELGME